MSRLSLEELQRLVDGLGVDASIGEPVPLDPPPDVALGAAPDLLLRLVLACAKLGLSSHGAERETGPSPRLDVLSIGDEALVLRGLPDEAVSWDGPRAARLNLGSVGREVGIVIGTSSALMLVMADEESGAYSLRPNAGDGPSARQVASPDTGILESGVGPDDDIARQALREAAQGRDPYTAVIAAGAIGRHGLRSDEGGALPPPSLALSRAWLKELPPRTLAHAAEVARGELERFSDEVAALSSEETPLDADWERRLVKLGLWRDRLQDVAMALAWGAGDTSLLRTLVAVDRRARPLALALDGPISHSEEVGRLHAAKLGDPDAWWGWLV